MIDTSYVDVVFPLKGRLLPLDNGYLVYSALSRLCSNIHELNGIGIHPIAGKPNRYKQLKLTSQSKLKIRISLEQIPSIYQFLVEQTFKIGESQFHIGIPDEYKALTSAPSLYSRLVIIRRCMEIEDFTITPQAVEDYQFASENLIDNQIFVYDNQSFTVKVNSIRAIIADNLAHSLPWWWNLWEKLYEADPFESENLDQQLVFNRRGLLAMLQQDTKLQIYRDFICAIHEALRKIYAKTYDRKKSRVENNQRIDKKYQSIRSELSRCYDQESLEDFLADFLSRAGLNSSLYDQWEQILPLIVSEINWKKTRNLSLLALASYKPRGFSLREITIGFWKMLLEVNYQAAILFLLKEPILEIFPETQE